MHIHFSFTLYMIYNIDQVTYLPYFK
ncbi:hypothetical protein F383_37284 [Gossypium arboreum]|uniref:Uncharacterized protein n=1 Tax=Gossypium arboreum TaxID=29729 RepID=A0A0B0MGE2_GOSAR|nr:hypothetical protein F383_37284 [Gossypium arboreum]